MPPFSVWKRDWKAVSDAMGTAGRLGEIQALLHWGDIPCRNTNELGVAAPGPSVAFAPSDLAIPLSEFGDVRPGSLHDTGGIHAGDEWKREVIARACFRIGWIDTRIADADQCLSWGSGTGACQDVSPFGRTWLNRPACRRRLLESDVGSVSVIAGEIFTPKRPQVPPTSDASPNADRELEAPHRQHSRYNHEDDARAIELSPPTAQCLPRYIRWLWWLMVPARAALL